MENFYDAFNQLKRKDKIVLGVSAAGIIAMVAAGLLLLLNIGGLRLKFPDSSANNAPDFQTKQTLEFTDLTVPIIFPGTTLGCDVGGELVKASVDGCLFKFSDEALIATYVIPGDADILDYVKNNYASLLADGQETKYKHKKYVKGYLNEDAVEYEGGILKTEDESFYILNYRHLTGEDRDALISVVTTDPKRLNKGMQLLEKIWHTMGRYEYVEAAEVPEEEAVEDVEEAEVAGATKEENPNYNYNNTVLDMADEYDEMMRKRMEEVYQANNSDAEYLEQKIVVSRRMASAPLVFDCYYFELFNTPEEMFAEGPDGRVIHSSYNNEYKDGHISVFVDEPIVGTWTVKVKNSTPLGGYEIYCTDREGYDAMMDVEPSDELGASRPAD